MLMKVVIFGIFLSLLSSRAIADEYMARLEEMARSGAITQESAREEKIRLKVKKMDHSERSHAQRGLASLNPALKPLEIRRFKAEKLILFLD
jgi:uncharacterized membrane protein (DUF106 family)